jgi:hypothetical protein
MIHVIIIIIIIIIIIVVNVTLGLQFLLRPKPGSQTPPSSTQQAWVDSGVHTPLTGQGDVSQTCRLDVLTHSTCLPRAPH